MTQEQKAIYLINLFLDAQTNRISFYDARLYALMTVEELIENSESEEKRKYFIEVRTEILKS
jgi:hypothetical protein